MAVTSIENLRSRERLLSGTSNEFAKLSATDKLVCLYVTASSKVELKIWLAYTIRNYLATGVQIDVVKLLDDINRFEEDGNRIDRCLGSS